jgi:hypothetical protein
VRRRVRVRLIVVRGTDDRATHEGWAGPGSARYSSLCSTTQAALKVLLLSKPFQDGSCQIPTEMW